MSSGTRASCSNSRGEEKLFAEDPSIADSFFFYIFALWRPPTLSAKARGGLLKRSGRAALWSFDHCEAMMDRSLAKRKRTSRER